MTRGITTREQVLAVGSVAFGILLLPLVVIALWNRGSVIVLSGVAFHLAAWIAMPSYVLRKGRYPGWFLRIWNVTWGRIPGLYKAN